MRDKFRAWDVRTGKIYVSNGLPFDGFSMFGECTLLATPSLEDLEYLEVEQYLDYYDREETELCEGDIVEVRYSLSAPHKQVRNRFISIGVIVYEDGKYHLRHSGKNGCSFPLSHTGKSGSVDEMLLKVGNAHENSEMLI